MTQPLAEVRENEASDEVRAIYQSIKEATGIPQVNLIFRHLALEPEVLIWAWDVVGPLYRSGLISKAVTELRPGLDGVCAIAPTAAKPVWEHLPENQADACRQLEAVLAFYNRGNPANLIGLTTLVRAVAHDIPLGAEGRGAGDDGAARAPDLDTGSGSIPAVSIPPLPARDSLSIDARQTVEALAQNQGGAALGVTPSLYLHIATWPAAIAHAQRVVPPVISAPEWPRRIDHLLDQARDWADGHAGALRLTRPAPPEARLQPFVKTVAHFIEKTIPEMVIIGQILAGNGR